MYSYESLFQFSLDKRNHEVLVCESCAVEVKEAYEFRQEILKSEHEYFCPQREAAIAEIIDSDEDEETLIARLQEGFDMCRVCLVPSYAVDSKTIFKSYGENGMEYVEMLFHLTDFNVSCVRSCEGFISFYYQD
jgi:hypothetical protein